MAVHGCATAHPDARSARGGRDDQVGVGFVQDFEVEQRFTGDEGADNRARIS